MRVQEEGIGVEEEVVSVLTLIQTNKGHPKTRIYFQRTKTNLKFTIKNKNQSKNHKSKKTK